MERLTNKKLKTMCNGSFVHFGSDKERVKYRMLAESAPKYEEIYKKLADYEDAEEQGLLLRLPCKVGDKVYADSNCFGVLEYEVDEIIINGGKITFLCSAYSTPIGDCPSECLDEIEPDITDFGKLVFLTKEAAEQKLTEMGGE